MTGVRMVRTLHRSVAESRPVGLPGPSRQTAGVPGAMSGCGAARFRGRANGVRRLRKIASPGGHVTQGSKVYLAGKEVVVVVRTPASPRADASRIDPLSVRRSDRHPRADGYRATSPR